MIFGSASQVKVSCRCRIFFRVLKAAGYNGYFTLEWEKIWHAYIEEPEVAFPQYVQYMKNLEEEQNEYGT